MEKNYRRNQRMHALGIIGLVLVCVATIGFGVVTISKYVLDWEDKRVSIPEGFYFESDYLQYVTNEEDIPHYTVYTSSLPIIIRNHNNILATEETITYEISCKELDVAEEQSDRAKLIDEEKADVAGKSYSLLYDVNTKKTEDAFTLSYEIGNIYDSHDQTTEQIVSIQVTAVSSDPYAKTITAIFDFKSANESTFYRLTSNDYYMQLELFTGLNINEDSVITINYNDLAPDNTNDLMETWLTLEEKNTLTGLSQNGYYKFVFFKANLAELSTENSGDRILTVDSNSTGTITIPSDTLSSTES